MLNLHPNNIKLSGTGSKSTVTIKYSFNSGASTIFRMADYQSSISSCLVADTPLQLVAGDKKQEAAAGFPLVISPSTDYVLTQKFTARDCTDFDLQMSLIAWTGTSMGITADPALVCNGKLGQVIVFDTFSSGATYTSSTGTKPFSNLATFCGEKTAGPKTEDSCSISDGEALSGDDVNCAAQSGADVFTYQVKKTGDHSATMSCTKNGKLTYKDDLKNCTNQLQDFNAVNGQ